MGPTPTAQPILRRDLEWTRRSNSQQRWVLHDPLAGQYFMMSDLEREVALSLDGRALVDVLSEVQEHADATITIEWIENLVRRFKHLNLLEVRTAADCKRKWALRQSARESRTLTQTLLNPLAIRIPLIDPTALLPRMSGLATFLFSRGLQLLLLLVTPFLGLAVLNRLLSGYSLFKSWESAEFLSQPGFWLGFFICLGFAKTWHELGHILACARYGAPCKEAGIMLLCFMPCFYCDTSHAWKLASRWERAMISFAGVYFEWMLACVAASLWLLTHEGAVHWLSGTFLVLCSASTLLVNLNPLLRYDGYYILSDLTEVPNLTEQSKRAVRTWISEIFTVGIGHQGEASKSKLVAGLLLYGVASFAYRSAMIIVILLFVWRFLSPIGLGPVAVALSSSVVLGVAMQLGNGARQWRREIGSSGRRLRWPFLGIALALLGAGVWFAMNVPLPHHMRARGLTRSRDRAPVFATQQAELVEFRASPLRIQLSAPDSEREIYELEASLELLNLEIRQLEERQVIDELAAYQLPSKRELQREREQRLESLQRDAAQLVIEDSKPDHFFVASSIQQPEATLARFPERIVDQDNSLGRTVERGALLGWMVNANSVRQVVVEVEGWQSRRLREGLSCQVCLDSMPSQRLAAKVVHIASEPSPTKLSNQRDSDASQAKYYTVVVELETQNSLPMLPEGGGATVRFNLANACITERLQDFWALNFRP